MKDKLTYSRIGIQTINIDKLDINIHENIITGKNSKGLTFNMEINDKFKVLKEGKIMKLNYIGNSNEYDHYKAMHGTLTSILKHKCQGLIKPFENEIIADGVGYRIGVKTISTGTELNFKVSKSHNVIKVIPKSITIEAVSNNIIKLFCHDKAQLGQCIAEILKIEPYSVYGKNKGIKSKTQYIIKKAINKK